MNNTLSLALIDVVFGLLKPIGITSYQIEMQDSALSALKSVMLNEEKGSIYHLPIHEAQEEDVVIKKDGAVIVFTTKP